MISPLSQRSESRAPRSTPAEASPRAESPPNSAPKTTSNATLEGDGTAMAFEPESEGVEVTLSAAASEHRRRADEERSSAAIPIVAATPYDDGARTQPARLGQFVRIRA